MSALHIATSLQVLKKHRHTRFSVPLAQREIASLAAHPGTEADQRLREELERRTGLPIAELAAIAREWA